MKIRAITPIRVGAEELQRRQARYDRLCPEGIYINLEDLPDAPESPLELASPAHLVASEKIGVELGSTTDPATYDALLPDCVLDPGVVQLDDCSAVPVLAITRLSGHFLAALGTRFGVITRNSTIAEEYRAVIDRYGLSSAFAGAYVLDLDVADIADTEKWNAAVGHAAMAAESAGVSVLLNGCSAVETTINTTGIRIVDPTALALKTIAYAAREGHFN